MADADPIKQLQHLLDDPGKVLEKISRIQSRSAALPARSPNPDASGAIYDRIAASLRALKMQIAERTVRYPTK